MHHKRKKHISAISSLLIFTIMIPFFVEYSVPNSTKISRRKSCFCPKTELLFILILWSLKEKHQQVAKVTSVPKDVKRTFISINFAWGENIVLFDFLCIIYSLYDLLQHNLYFIQILRSHTFPVFKTIYFDFTWCFEVQN